MSIATYSQRFKISQRLKINWPYVNVNIYYLYVIFSHRLKNGLMSKPTYTAYMLYLAIDSK